VDTVGVRSRRLENGLLWTRFLDANRFPLRLKTLALAGDGDIFGAAAETAAFAGFDHRSGHFIGLDPTERSSLGEVVRLAIGSRHRRPAAFALGEAQIDAVTVGLVGDNKDPAVGRSAGQRQQQRTDGQGQNRSHGSPKRGGWTRAIPLSRKALIFTELPQLRGSPVRALVPTSAAMINRVLRMTAMPAAKREKCGFCGLDAVRRTDHGAGHDRFSRHNRHLPRDY